MSGGWEPISTAPRDGEHVQLRFDPPGAMVLEAFWSERAKAWRTPDEFTITALAAAWRPLGGA